jgi:carboxyl-terminal processing protease
VYGGGGIMPDVCVAIDTSYNSSYFRKLAGKNVLNSFALEYFDKNRTTLTGSYKTFDDFKNRFTFTPDEISAFIARGEAEGVVYDEAQYNISKDEIILILKGLIASNLWQVSEYFQIINQNDNVIERALKVISDGKAYNAILGYK